MEEQQGIRWIQRLANYNRALDQVEAAVSLAQPAVPGTISASSTGIAR